jgi:hypothetical protein
MIAEVEIDGCRPYIDCVGATRVFDIVKHTHNMKEQLMIEFTLPETVSIPVTGVDGKSVEFTLANCNLETIVNLIIHGAKQIANDANAGAKKAGASDAMLTTTVEEKLAELETGEHRFGGGGGGARVSDLEKEIRKIIESRLPKNIAAKDRPKAARDLLSKADRASAKFQAIVKMAEAAIAARGADEIDLDDII